MTDRNTGELAGGKSCLRKAIILIESCLFILKEGIFFAILQEMKMMFPFISKTISTFMRYSLFSWQIMPNNHLQTQQDP